VSTFDVEHSADQIEVFRFLVALGNPLNHQAAEAVKSDECEFISTSPNSATLKSGYHSLCVGSTGEYVIFNPAQVKCCNLVRFAGGDNLSIHTELNNICDICRTNQAVIWCVNDSAKLCKDCDTESHKHNHILAKHRRIPLSSARAIMEFCPEHSDSRIDYYCPQCQTPVCINCKMTGSHSKGEAATHSLISITEAYQESLKANETEDPIFIRRRTVIQNKFTDADKVLHEIIHNEEAVETEIKRKATAAIQHARKLAGEKALIVRSVQTELQRKLNEMDGITRSIADQKKTSGPLAFLRASDRHSLLISSLQGVSDLPSDLTVHGDLTVSGDLTVGPVGDEPALIIAVTNNSQEFVVDLHQSEIVDETQSQIGRAHV
jgi:hypothetical protein